MNKIIVNKPLEKQKEYTRGDLFTHLNDENSSDIYILSNLGNLEWAAISLSDGNRWKNSTKNIDEAIKGLKYLGDDAQIIVNFR